MTSHRSTLAEVAASTWPPIREDIQHAVIAAVNQAAVDNAGQVTAATMRPHLPPWAIGNQQASIVALLVQRGVLRDTGQIARSENYRAGNGNRLMRVYRLTRDAHVDDLRPAKRKA